MTVLFLLALLVVLPASGAWLSENSLLQCFLIRPVFRVGAPIIYRRSEASTHPVVDACDVRPSERGEFYYYSIINYLRVAEILGDGRIIAIARNNQRLCFWPNDSSLRKARLTERLLHRPRFPHR